MASAAPSGACAAAQQQVTDAQTNLFFIEEFGAVLSLGGPYARAEVAHLIAIAELQLNYAQQAAYRACTVVTPTGIQTTTSSTTSSQTITITASTRPAPHRHRPPRRRPAPRPNPSAHRASGRERVVCPAPSERPADGRLTAATLGARARVHCGVRGRDGARERSRSACRAFRASAARGASPSSTGATSGRSPTTATPTWSPSTSADHLDRRASFPTGPRGLPAPARGRQVHYVEYPVLTGSVDVGGRPSPLGTWQPPVFSRTSRRPSSSST